LADRADPEGKCWPGHQRTAADLNLAESTVRLAVQTLAGAGLLSVQRREIEGRSASNIYFLAVDNCPGDEENRVPKSGTRVPNKPDGRVPKSGTESISKENLPQKREGARCARPVGAGPHTPRSRRGGIELDQDTGLHHDPASQRDTSAIQQIRRYPSAKIKEAIELSAARDDQGRAFPSSVLRILKRGVGGGGNDDNTPAWARAGKATQANQIIEGDAKWIE
jgi:hypothetical protein